MILPRKLRAGDKVAAISLSWGGPAAFPHRYAAGKRQLEAEFGLEVVETEHALREPAWLYAHPEARAADLMTAFTDPSIKAIFSTIGGNDSIRLLPYFDLDLVAANPKVFMGMSDTTVTHLALRKAGLATFYGPALMMAFAENGGMFPYFVDSVRRTLFTAGPVGPVQPSTEGWTDELLDWAIAGNQSRKRALNPSMGWKFLQGRGKHRGRLMGGCLEVLDWLRGTPVWPSLGEWEGAILFIEASEEAPPPASLTYALRALAAMGVLERLAGILFGRPGGQTPVEKFREYDEAILRVTAEAGRADMPVISNMDFGHTDPVFVLPYGAESEIDCDEQSFAIIEGTVTD